MPAAAAVAAIVSPPELSLNEGRLWCELIERRCGVFFPETQWRHLRRRLWERMLAASIPAYSQYYHLLTENRWQTEWARLLEDLLNPETSFFRHGPSFKALGALLTRRGSQTESCALWSAGCSTGEEAYSLAMAAVSLTGAADVVGSDLHLSALDQARAGMFSARQSAGVPPAWRTRFLTEARPAGQFEVAGELRSHVRFEPFHLLDPSTYPRREFDVIFCFNILIYFRPPARQEALTGLLGRLKPGGHLFLAPGESAGLAFAGGRTGVGGRYSSMAARVLSGREWK